MNYFAKIILASSLLVGCGYLRPTVDPEFKEVAKEYSKVCKREWYGSVGREDLTYSIYNLLNRVFHPKYSYPVILGKCNPITGTILFHVGLQVREADILHELGHCAGGRWIHAGDKHWQDGCYKSIMHPELGQECLDKHRVYLLKELCQ